ncbi:hypothetical protein [Pseudomonas sp. NA-150]|uniref:hypothetical protein n=1 Tax=Pseudomonas sp. NA-150 TaxID=3367525 RepID=UPI0037CAC7C5
MTNKHFHRLGTCPPISRAMDVTMIATTVGCAAIANMVFPSMGSAVVGAVLGAIIGFRSTKST